MKTEIKFTTYGKPAEEIISKALGFNAILSKSAIIDIFCQNNLPHNCGIFKSKKLAKIIADRINSRGSFGGFADFVHAEIELIK